jgi:RNA polymerase sigma factor (TIGR02999 family)
MLSASNEITRLLEDWNRGEPDALERLIPAVYSEMRSLARRHLQMEQAVSLQPTELVHEVFFRIAAHRKPDFRNRAHFFGAIAEMMRRFLVDLARSRKAAKRGATMVRVELSEAEKVPANDLDLELVDVALNRLMELDPLQGKLVELRFFGGLTIEEAAAVMEISTATAKREWRLAKAWLLRELERG